MAETNIKLSTDTLSAKAAKTNAPIKSEPFEYTRKVTVRALTNYSAYRQVNIGVLGRRRSNIGSSITSANILSSNKGEVEAYFPQLIGLSANNQNFITRVKDYLSNIQVPVDDEVSFDNSFIFNTEEDYRNFREVEDKINAAYDKADKRDLKSLKEAINKRVTALNEAESELYKVGKPKKLEDYILYRHVLLYKEVAKDLNLASSDKSIRFYLVDATREQNRLEKKMRETKKAMSNFVSLGNNDEKFEAVFVRYCALYHYNLAQYLSKNDTEKNILLSQFVQDEPIKFNEICADSNLMTIAFIERLMARGELVRSEYNQQISTSDGQFIAKNLNDAVAYFNNPENKDVRAMYEAKLKVTSY